MTTLKDIYTDYVKYNLWANKKMVALFESLKKEQLEENITSSFPSVRLTLLHLWDTEVIWMERLKGNSLSFFPSWQFKGDNKGLFEGFISNSTEFLNFVESQSDDFFDKDINYQNTKGGTFTQPAREIIHHCMNHQHYHRGQLVTMARQLGLKEIPATDYIFYLREK